PNPLFFNFPQCTIYVGQIPYLLVWIYFSKIRTVPIFYYSIIATAHKGDFGHVLVLGSWRGLTGAGVLCANAALRSGAGLVTLACPEDQQPIVAKKVFPEIMTLALPYRKTFDFLFKFICRRKIDCLAVGPGLSVSERTRKLV
ncbi:unnamed protein product, partial [marine sediment metagenome]